MKDNIRTLVCASEKHRTQNEQGLSVPYHKLLNSEPPVWVLEDWLK